MTRLGAVMVLPLAVYSQLQAPHTPVNMESVLFPAPQVGETIGKLSLPAEERPVLLRAATAALERGPDPLPVVHTEGTLPMLPAYKRAAQAKRDWRSMSVLANAYAMSREPRYLDGYARYLTAWLDVYRISGNPIDETALGEWLLAYRSAGTALTPGWRPTLEERKPTRSSCTLVFLSMRTARPRAQRGFLSEKAQFTFWLAAQVDRKWLELSRKLGTPSITQRASWLVR